MRPYATLADLDARRSAPVTGGAARRRARTLIVDACERINAEMAAAGLPAPEPGSARWAACAQVCCAMVARALSADGLEGVTTQQQTAGPYSFSLTRQNPMGDLYLTSAERRALGIRRARTSFVPPAIRAGGD